MPHKRGPKTDGTSVPADRQHGGSRVQHDPSQELLYTEPAIPASIPGSFLDQGIIRNRMKLSGKELIELDDFRLDVRNRRVERAGKPVHFPPKAFDTLLALIQAHPGAVTRAELLQTLWPDTAVEDSNVTQNIYVVRKALGCNADGSDYVETVAKHGYRLNGELQIVSDPCALPPVSPIEPALPPQELGIAARRPVPWAFYASALLVILLSGLAISYGWSRRSKHFQALSLVQQGFLQVRENRISGLGPANALFRQALDLEPGLATAHAGLAEVMARSVEPSSGQAATMAERAIRLDPRCAECKAIAGWILMGREWRFREAARYLDEAAAGDSHNARILLWHAQLLACTGKLEHAVTEIERARAIDFKQPAVATMRAGILYLLGRYEQAITAAHEALGLDPAHPSAYDWIYRSCIRLQRVDEALAAKAALNAVFLGLSADARFDMEARWSSAYHQGGLEKLVETLLSLNASKPALDHHRYERATWKMWIGDRAGALNELEHVIDFRPFDAIYVGVDPMFAPLRGEPRFQELISRMGLDAIESRVFSRAGQGTVSR